MPRIQAKTVVAHRALIRSRILDAFGEQLHEHGYAAVTLAKVAAAAGIARNTIYNYAADKDELMLDYVQREVHDFVAATADAMAALPSASAKLSYLIRQQVESFQDQAGSGGMLEGSSLPPAVFGQLMGRLSEMRYMLAEVVSGGIASGEFRPVKDLDSTVELIMATVGSQRMPIGDGVRTVEQAVARVDEFVLASLRV